MVLCAGAFGCYAAQGSLPGAQGQGYDLNLSYSRTTLKAVADAITQQVGIAFSYETALAGYPMENLEVSEKGATIEAILAAVFTPRGIDYRVVDKVVVLTRSTRPVPAASAAAKSEVKGVVRDAAGNPMIGVTVTIKGTLVGVSTGVDGGYAIPADGNATLLFSYIGYRPHEEVVGRRTQIDVTMQEDELVMDEVVVVGYGTLKKRNIVGAVENLSGDAVENRPNANITRSLQGQIPGLNIVQVDGKADHAGEVTIRGVNNTFKARVSGGEKTNKLGQGGGALVLIDGAEGDMGSVNPDDIASISVLKDASSAAVYGARGAFGVILITTKDPEKGKVRVSYNGSVSLHRRTVIWEDNVVTDPVQWVDAFRESYLNSSPTATVPSLFNNYMPYSNAWFEELKRRRANRAGRCMASSASIRALSRRSMASQRSPVAGEMSVLCALHTAATSKNRLRFFSEASSQAYTSRSSAPLVRRTRYLYSSPSMSVMVGVSVWRSNMYTFRVLPILYSHRHKNT